MTKQKPQLKLGKGAAFVKTRLKRLDQEEETWEADFRALQNRSLKTVVAGAKPRLAHTNHAFALEVASQ